MLGDYTGKVQLWEKRYVDAEGDKNGDIIERKIKGISHIELEDGKLTFNKARTLTIVQISKVPVYKDKKQTSEYRRLVRIETTGNGKIPKDTTELLKRGEFTRL